MKKGNLKSVSESNNYFLGYLTAEELLNCIAPINSSDAKRKLDPDVFKNNIRLYLGATSVNKNIEKTLLAEPHQFHLYNNGLTITTKTIDTSNISNYKISPVNRQCPEHCCK